MRFADPKRLSARAESPDGAPPNPQVRTATAARLNKCRAIGIAPTLKPGGAERKAPQAQISDYSQNSSILRLRYPVVIALTAGNEGRISPPDFLPFRITPLHSTLDKELVRWPVVAS